MSQDISAPLVKVFVAVFGFVALMVGLSALFALPVEWLWNAVIPGIFVGLKTITFLQAWGLNLLSGFLLKTVATTSSK